MKKTKLSLICTVICMILTVAILSVIALASEHKAQTINNADETPITSTAEKSPLTRTYTDGAGTAVNLTYSRTKDLINHKGIDIYLDSAGYEYMYDSKGNFLGMTSGIPSKAAQIEKKVNGTKTESKEITEEYLIEVAKECGHNMFGTEFDKLTDNTMIELLPSGNSYFVRFDKAYGVDNFILGTCCTLIINLNGSVNGCTMMRGPVPDEFNEDLVKSLTKETVLAAAEKEAKKTFSTVSEMTEEMISLEKIDGKYVIKSSVSFVTTDPYSASLKAFCETNDFFLTDHEYDDVNRVSTSYLVSGNFYYPLEP